MVVDKAAKDALQKRRESGEMAGVSQQAESAYSYGFKDGARFERNKWEKFRWHIASVNKPEPDSYIVAVELSGREIVDVVVGCFVADSEPFVSNSSQARMWKCVDRWCYFDELAKTMF